MHADLVSLETEVREQWSYLELRETQGLDLTASFERARNRTNEALSLDDFGNVVRELVAELLDGHAYVQVPGAIFGPRRRPFLLCDTVEGVAVLRVATELDLVSGDNPLQVGDLVHTLDGRPIEELVAEAQRRVFGSTAGMARRAAFSALQYLGADREQLEVELQDSAGVRRTIVLGTPVGIVPGVDTYLEPRELWSLSFPAERIALLRVPDFSPPDWAVWGAAPPEERDAILDEQKRSISAHLQAVVSSGAEALVLDLRGNGGGTDLLGIHLARHLVPKKFTYYRLSSKLGGQDWGRPSGYIHEPFGAEHLFRGPLVALIDEGCFSVTDNFLRCLDDEHEDFITIGRPSGGGTGAPRTMPALPNSGIAVTLCTMRVYGPAGELIEGSGTVPDIPITPLRADLAAGNDPTLAAALRYIEERRTTPRDG